MTTLDHEAGTVTAKDGDGEPVTPAPVAVEAVVQATVDTSVAVPEELKPEASAVEPQPVIRPRHPPQRKGAHGRPFTSQEPRMDTLDDHAFAAACKAAPGVHPDDAYLADLHIAVRRIAAGRTLTPAQAEDAFRPRYVEIHR